MWRRVCGEITTVAKNLETLKNLGRSSTMKGLAKAQTVWVCPPGGLTTTLCSSLTNPGGRAVAPALGEVVPAIIVFHI